MLRKISVSGFKSLDRFHLEFRQGLNVLVGPNGSGKTNIINFIEFLSYISTGPLLEAVGRSGGAGRIFRRKDTGSLTKSISFEIGGSGSYLRYSNEKPENVAYEYSAEIQLSENNSAIYFQHQRLRLAILDKQHDHKSWPVDIEVVATSDEKSRIIFHSLDGALVEDRYMPRTKRGEGSLEDIKEQIANFCSDYARTLALYQFVDRYIDAADSIPRDLFGAQSFNISPAIVRTPEDIASEPEIGQDGRGLAATLYALTSASHGQSRRPYFRHRMRHFEEPHKMVSSIISYSKLVNPAIEHIFVAPDTVEAKLRIFLQIKAGGSIMTLPFSLVSDGTAKWFALVTAIMTTPSVFAIEEPENFLHPLMQKEIVNIVRSNFASPDKQAFAVMTTHSETILNSIDPEDMILVHMDNGRTIASRPLNADDIRDEIKNTGFGAGYYYIAGAIE